MKKYLVLLLTLCLFMYGCEQQNMTLETTHDNQEIIDRAAPCDLTQIPLYVSPAETAQRSSVDFSTAFPVAKSEEYEKANGSNITIQQLNYRVNNSPISREFVYRNNTNYNLVIDVRYSIDDVEHFETFSLCFGVKGEQELEWGCSNYCEAQEATEIESRGLTSIYILP